MDEAWAPSPPMPPLLLPVPPAPPAAPAPVPASGSGDDADGDGGGLADGVDTAPNATPTSIELATGSGDPISTATIVGDGSGDEVVDPTSGTPSTTNALGDDPPPNGELLESGDMAALLRARTLVLGDPVFSDDEDEDIDSPVFSALPESPDPTPLEPSAASASTDMPPPAVPSLADLEQRREALRAKKEALRSGVQKREYRKETNEHQINLQSCLLKVNSRFFGHVYMLKKLL